MTTISQIRDGLAARLATIPGLRVHDTVPGQINPPAAVVRRRQTRYDITLDGADDYTMVVTVFVQASNDRTAQDAIDAYIDASGASSVVAAIHVDPTLGGVVDFARVVSAEEDGLTEFAQIEYLAVTFVVEIGK